MRNIYSCLMIAFALIGAQQCTAQYGTFGEATCPEDSAAVDDIIYYGELLDMSGGYVPATPSLTSPFMILTVTP